MKWQKTAGAGLWFIRGAGIGPYVYFPDEHGWALFRSSMPTGAEFLGPITVWMAEAWDPTGWQAYSMAELMSKKTCAEFALNAMIDEIKRVSPLTVPEGEKPYDAALKFIRGLGSGGSMMRRAALKDFMLHLLDTKAPAPNYIVALTDIAEHFGIDLSRPLERKTLRCRRYTPFRDGELDPETAPPPPIAPAPEETVRSRKFVPYVFEDELRKLINRHSVENFADMPDFRMAGMICRMIEAMGPSIKQTLDWHGCKSVCHPGPRTPETPPAGQTVPPVRRCPACHFPAEFRSADDANSKTPAVVWLARCSRCFLIGPRAPTREAAASLWNEMAASIERV